MSKNSNDDNSSSLKKGKGNKKNNVIESMKGVLTCLVVLIGPIVAYYLFIVFCNYISGTAFFEILVNIFMICFSLFVIFLFGLFIYVTLIEAKSSNGESCLFFIVFMVCLFIVGALYRNCAGE